MELFEKIKLISTIVIGAIFLLVAYKKSVIKSTRFNAKFFARSGIFAAFSIILYLVPVFNISLPIFPSFLKLHFDEVPALIAGFSFGPYSAALVIFLKTLVKFPLSETLGVGELSDLLMSIAFVIPASIIYSKKKTLKQAVVSISISTIIQLVVSSFLSTFVILNFYISLMGFSKEFLLSLCQSVNPNITNLEWAYMLYVSLPFNAIKDAIVVVFTFLLYKRISILAKKY